MWQYSLLYCVLSAFLVVAITRPPMADNNRLNRHAATHSEKFRVSLTKGDIAHISGLSNVHIPPQISGEDVTWKRAGCVYNTQKNGYRVMLDNASSKSKVSHKYDISWNPSGLNGNGEELHLRPGVPVTVNKTTDIRTLCSGQRHMTEASLTIKIPKNVSKQTGASNRSGSITLLISPN
jgi:hypothetical protein